MALLYFAAVLLAPANRPPGLPRTSDLFITRELHTPQARGCMGFAASIKSTQRGQRGRVEVVYVQNPPTPTTLIVSTGATQKLAPPSWRLLMSASPSSGTSGWSGVRSVGEPLPGCLPGDSQGNRDLVP